MSQDKEAVGPHRYRFVAVPGFKWPRQFIACLRESLEKTEPFTEREALETEHADSK